MNTAYVIGGNHHNTLGVIRSLGYKGVKSILILVSNSPKPYVSYSKFIKKTIRVSDDEEIVTVLKHEALNFSEKAVLILCSDSSSSVIDIHRDELQHSYFLPGNPIQGGLTHFMNKEEMANLARSIGINVPKTWIVEKDDDINGIEYPCITKPLLSKDGHKSDINICYSSRDLFKVLQNGSCNKYQVQRFIVKDFEYQLIGLSLNRGNDVIIPGISRIIRPCKGTNTGFLHYENIGSFDIPLDKCREFVKKVNYSGLFSIEFLRDKQGKDYFLEMNFRNDGNSICVTKSGVNLPYIWYLYCKGLDYRDELSKSKVAPVYIMPELDDIYFMLKGKISLIKWIKDIRRADAFMEYDKYDKRPFFVALRTFIYKNFIRIIKLNR